MKLALDIDGTLSENPPMFRKFMESVLKGGGEVYIITGRIGEEEKISRNPEHRIRQLEKFGIPRECYTEIIEVVRKEYLPIAFGKADICRIYDFDLCIENDMNYINKIHRNSRTQCLLIIPREGGET